uniref:Uncharacterized protein n=1 Tax=Acrobeloides nanus TaxID=290746 RepID=A0A914DJM6_9BILA
MMRIWDSIVLSKLQRNPKMANKIAPALGFFSEIAEDFVSNVTATTSQTKPTTQRLASLKVPTPATQRLPEKSTSEDSDILLLDSPKLPLPKRTVYRSILIGNAIDKYFYRKGLANPTFIKCENTTEALLDISNHIRDEQYGLAVLVFEKAENFEHNANKALVVLAQIAHVYKFVGPQHWEGKNMEANFEEIEVETEEADLMKIGLKIIMRLQEKGTR